MKMKRVLCIVENGFEEIEAIVPVDLLRRAGVEVVMAGASCLEPIGKSGIRIRADGLLEDQNAEDFHVLFLPGGPAVKILRKNLEVIDLIRKFHGKEKIIAAICAAPLLLFDAGLLEGRIFTAHFSTDSELPSATGGKLESDGCILTSRGAGTAMEFGLALVEILQGKKIAAEVSASIMA